MSFKKYCYQKNKKCVDCDNLISDWAIRCQKCNPKTYKFSWTKKQEELLIKNYPIMKSKELSKIIGKNIKSIDNKVRKQFQFLKKNKKAINLNCKNCDKLFKRNVSLLSSGKWGDFCSRICRGEFISKNIVGDKHHSWRGGYIPYFGNNWHFIRNQIRKSTELICVKCGVSEKLLNEELHLHHKIPRRFFNKVEDSNIKENLMLLCKHCHLEVEHATDRILRKMRQKEEIGTIRAEIGKLFECNAEMLPRGV